MREKWTINRLHDETLMDRRTIKKVLGETKPVESDGKSDYFHLSDFLEAWRKHLAVDRETLNLTVEQARLTAANADIAEVKRAKLRHTVIDVESVFQVWENIGVAIRRTILTSGLTEKEKDHVLNELQSLNIDALVEQQEFDGEAQATTNGHQ